MVTLLFPEEDECKAYQAVQNEALHVTHVCYACVLRVCVSRVCYACVLRMCVAHVCNARVQQCRFTSHCHLHNPSPMMCWHTPHLETLLVCNTSHSWSTHSYNILAVNEFQYVTAEANVIAVAKEV